MREYLSRLGIGFVKNVTNKLKTSHSYLVDFLVISEAILFLNITMLYFLLAAGIIKRITRRARLCRQHFQPHFLKL